MTRRRSYIVSRLTSVIAILAVVGVMTSVVSGAVYRRRHPAPLGRSVADVERFLAAQLPVGISVERASATIRNAGVEHSVNRAVADVRCYQERDTMYAGGAVIVALERDIDRSLFVTESIQLHLYFDATGQLARRRVVSVFAGW